MSRLSSVTTLKQPSCGSEAGRHCLDRDSRTLIWLGESLLRKLIALLTSRTARALKSRDCHPAQAQLNDRGPSRDVVWHLISTQ